MSKEEERLKSEILKQPISTANSKLRKMLLFKYVILAGEDICYRCGNRIESIEDFSIEHKKAWLHSGRGIELFFDLNNISFSHRECNSGASKQYKNGVHPLKNQISPKRKLGPEGTNWCRIHRDFLPIENFHKDSSTWTGYKVECTSCRSEYRKSLYRSRKEIICRRVKEERRCSQN